MEVTALEPSPNIISEIEINGFKAHFASTVPLSPITLILGANSAGKSSIFQSLLALKQSFARGPNQFGDLLTDGSSVSLGMFGNVQHRHQPEQTVSIGVTRSDGTRSLFAFGASGHGPQHDQNFLATDGAIGLLTVERGDERAVLHNWDRELDAESSERTLVASVDWSHASVGSASSPVSITFSLERESFVVSSPGQPEQEAAIHKLVSNAFYPFIWRIAGAAHIGPLRRAGLRAYDVVPSVLNEVGSTGENLATILLRRDVLWRVNRYLGHLSLPFRIAANRLPTLGHTIDLRVVDEKSGLSSGIQDVGFGVSQILPMLTQIALSSALFDEQRYENAGRFGTGTEAAQTADANIPRQLILMEQPELHLHPRLCVEFMRLLAGAHVRWKQDRNGAKPFVPRAQYLIETHSETLVEAAQQLVRTGFLTPSDICILSVEPDSSEQNRSVVRRIRLDENGRFLDRWPRGFFTEHRELAFGDLPKPP